MSVARTAAIDPWPAAAYRGTFAPDDDAPAPGDPLPAAWEGVYFPFQAPLVDLRADGTPARDGVVPDIDLPRRMYAGEDTEFRGAVRVGDTVTQEVSLGTVTEKHGSRGRLVFVDLVREYTVDGVCAIRSTWHDVFLDRSDADAADDDAAGASPEPRRAEAVAAAADWVDELVLDARQLFRFSALTFNTHLIHYDRRWAQEVEGLPDLLVHGPLTRILLMDAARRHEPVLHARSLSVRAVAPMLVDRRVRIAGRRDGDTTRLTALDDDAAVLATADVRWSRP